MRMAKYLAINAAWVGLFWLSMEIGGDIAKCWFAVAVPLLLALCLVDVGDLLRRLVVRCPLLSGNGARDCRLVGYR